MIVMKINGGLGNQMFEYALYTKLQSLGREVKLDLFRGESYLKKEKYPSLFNVCELDKNHKSLALRNECYWLRMKRRFDNSFLPTYKEEMLGKYDDNILKCDNVYLQGFWFNERYFLDCREELLRRYTFRQKLNAESLAVLNRIKNSNNPVSIHIRLGDYVSNESNRKQLSGICTEKYYRESINYIKRSVKTPTFFVFSDEPEKAAEIVGEDDKFVVDVNDRLTGWMDMHLISCCKHQIISNSTFSWWGAWLNVNPEKIVVAPSKWVNYPEVSNEIIPSRWIQIPSN